MASQTSLQHSSLNARLTPTKYTHVSSSGKSVPLLQYRGVPFGRIPARFNPSESIDSFNGADLDCTRFGPRCPQHQIDVGHLLRIPRAPGTKGIGEGEEEDEFKCLNCVITVPDGAKEGDNLPVLVWIHGGSIVVTYASVESGICDPSKIVADSVEQGTPIIVVSLNYRLNIFGFGDLQDDHINLGLRDQALGLKWTAKHIEGFGGSPDKITVAGESAGAFCTHGQTILGGPAQRAIMMSGSLFLSPPQPLARGQGFIAQLSEQVKKTTGQSLAEAPAAELLAALGVLNVKTMWNHATPALAQWQTTDEDVSAILVGDCEYETVIWRNGVESYTAPEIIAVFESIEGLSPALRQRLLDAYGIHADRDVASKNGVLDLVADVRFAWATDRLASKFRRQGKEAYAYIVDEPNPWQASARAHHAVDLLYLFEGRDLSFRPSAQKVAQTMRAAWIKFVNGEAPWGKKGGKEEQAFAFGPHGRCELIDRTELAVRRRVDHWKLLEEVGWDNLNLLTGKLVAGRISLDN